MQSGSYIPLGTAAGAEENDPKEQWFLCMMGLWMDDGFYSLALSSLFSYTLYEGNQHAAEPSLI